MNVEPTELPGVLLVEPRVFGDRRGWFCETWHAERYAEHGLPSAFAQDCLSSSRRGTLRGLHLQEPNAQGKLVFVLHGAVFDVAVDLRPGSETFGRWTAHELTAENHRQLWIPEGLAHGFLVLSDEALFAYKCTAKYAPECERAIRWDDPELAIDWPIEEPVLSAKDAAAPSLAAFLAARGRD